ncbi:MAG: AEC family transporter [Haloferacaceae archaeon]
MALLDIFASAILPIVALAGVGVLLGRVRAVDPAPLNTVTVYVLAPALVFYSLATTTLSGGALARITVGVVGFHLAMLVVAEGIGRLAGEREPLLSALVLVSVFGNTGNYGVPLSSFAFGATGRSTAVLYLTVQGVLIYTVGAYVAARSGGTSGLASVRRVLKLPLVYAVAAALALRLLGAVPAADTTLMRTVELVGNAAIPVMLLILGIQLARVDTAGALSMTWTPTLLKMLVAPVVALGVALATGFADPTVARTFVLESATPTAITTLILLGEFGEGAIEGVPTTAYVSTVVLVTTLASIPLLTALIAILRSGIVI